MRPTLLFLALAAPALAQDVPLQLWRNPDWPGGLDMGPTNGVSWGDHDRDGWPDVFAFRSGRLFRNVAGHTWTVEHVLSPDGPRYGSAFGDYDNDGLPDLASEPRGNANDMMLLHNEGGIANFLDVAQDPNVVDVVPHGDSETNNWVDTDFDGNLDLFVPVYPKWAGGPGNFFLHNLGPVGLGGAYAFTELSKSAGLNNPPPDTARSEGAEFCDVDHDGDPDGYCNGTLYQNVSSPGAPLFLDVSDDAGIQFRTILDEGCAFLDYDMDGDYDLVVSYCGGGIGNRVFENQGDGSFELGPKSLIESYKTGTCLGFSKADWDNDGDLDITTRYTWRRNDLMESDSRGFVLATHTIPGQHLSSATPAWADWDRDGDLDCALGNWMADGHFYENVLYGADTPDDERRYVRVRVMRDSDDFPAGLETEFGANVELFVDGSVDRRRRRQFVTSAGGYLNQSEYVLHFALPDDPAPDDDAVDLELDLVVDFVSDPRVGLTRVDRWVNPALGRIAVAELEDREVTVFRSGRAILNGKEFAPVPGDGTLHTTTTGGLALTAPGAPLPDPVPVPGADWYVGLAFDTSLASGPLRVKEVLLDGRLDPLPANCGGDVRLALWDTTDPANPFTVAETDRVRYLRNDRNAYPFEALLEPSRAYRLVARVDQLRATTVGAPVVNGALTVHGGLSFSDPTPCEGSDVVGAGVDAAQVYLALRFADDAGALWADLGNALPGTGGPATLLGTGSVQPGSQLTLDLTGAPPATATILVSGASAECRPLAGGVLVPSPDVLVPLTTDGAGAWSWSTNLPANLPPGTTTYFHVWWSDVGAPRGRAASNALSATSPY